MAKAAGRVSKPRPRGVRSRESAAKRRERCERIRAILHARYPASTCALRHASAYQLIVAVILSAQCTDERVNLVTPRLFERYPDVRSLSKAEPAELSAIIRSTGFFNNKTKNLIAMARRVVERFDGGIPDSMEDLLSLAGVARKTANCILGTWFGRNDGIVVDTHVGRIASRLRLLTTARDDKDAVHIEQDLMRLIPRDDWTWLSHALIDHGRTICTARNPDCANCPLAPHCPSCSP